MRKVTISVKIGFLVTVSLNKFLFFFFLPYIQYFLLQLIFSLGEGSHLAYYINVMYTLTM